MNLSRFKSESRPALLSLGLNEFSSLASTAQVLEKDKWGPKVFLLENGNILKIFRLKRWFSRALLYPYSLRFYRNAQQLAGLGIATLQPLALYRLPEKWKTAVQYEPLPGRTLRQVVDQSDAGDMAASLGRFVAELHEKGVYFRSLHLGNIIFTPEGGLGLIDVADTRFYKSRLNRWQRMRNLKHLCRLAPDREKLKSMGWRNFCEGYLSVCGAALDNQALQRRMQGLLE
jgi:tRNA A-37 threonylcarbamoyl transferase component Bud32